MASKQMQQQWSSNHHHSKSSSVRLGKQTHGSFVDRLFLREHISTLDREYEYERQKNIEYAKERFLVSQQEQCDRDSKSPNRKPLLIDNQMETYYKSNNRKDTVNSAHILNNYNGLNGPSPHFDVGSSTPLSGDSIRSRQKYTSRIALPQFDTTLQQQYNGPDTEERSKETILTGMAQTNTDCEIRIVKDHNDSANKLLTASMVARLGTINQEKYGNTQIHDKRFTINKNMVSQTQQTSALNNASMISQVQQSSNHRNISPQHKSIVSVSSYPKNTNANQNAKRGNSTSQASKKQPHGRIAGLLTTRTIQKGATMHSVGSRAVRNNLGNRESHQSRRQGGNGPYIINTDLQQVDEGVTYQIMNQTSRNGQKVMDKGVAGKINTMADNTSSNDEQRTLTPNSQLFIFQGKFDNKKSSQQDYEMIRVSPMRDTFQASSNSPNLLIGPQKMRNKINVTTAILGVTSSQRKESAIDTEYGTAIHSQRFGQETQNASELQRKSFQNEPASAVVSVLRQSQSGFNVSPENKHSQLIDLHFGQDQDSLQQNSLQQPATEDVQERVELQKTTNVTYSTPIAEANQICTTNDQGTADEDLNNLHENEDQNNKSTSQKRKNLDGLSEQERMEIRQTMNLVYPKLAISHITKLKKWNSKKSTSNSNTSVGRPWQKQKKGKKSNTSREVYSQDQQQIFQQMDLIKQTPLSVRDHRLNEPRNQIVFSQGQAQRRAGGIVFKKSLDSQPSLSPIDPRSMIFSQNVTQRTLLESSEGRETNYGRISKKPLMNKGFFQSESHQMKLQKFQNHQKHQTQILFPQRNNSPNNIHPSGLGSSHSPTRKIFQPIQTESRRQSIEGSKTFDLPSIRQSFQRNSNEVRGNISLTDNKNVVFQNKQSLIPKETILTSSVNNSLYGEREITQDLQILDQITRSELPVSPGAQKSFKSKKPASPVLKQEQFQFQLIDEQRRLDQYLLETGGTIVGKKKKMFKRNSGLSNKFTKTSPAEFTSASNTHNAAAIVSRASINQSPGESRGSPTKMMKDQSEEIRVSSPPIFNSNTSPHAVAKQTGNQKKRGKTSYEGKRDTPVKPGVAINSNLNANKQQGSTQGHSNSSNMFRQNEAPQNLVSSGEVSLANKAISINKNSIVNDAVTPVNQSKNADNGKNFENQTRLYLDINRKQVDMNPDLLSPQTLNENVKSPAKVHSQVSLSQLTNMSTERYIRKPLMGSSLANTARNNLNMSPESAWKPNMLVIAEGEKNVNSGENLSLKTKNKQKNEVRKLKKSNKSRGDVGEKETVRTLTMELHPTSQEESKIANEQQSQNQATSQLMQQTSKQISDKELKNQLVSQRKLSLQEPFRPIVSGGLRVSNIRVSENEDNEIQLSAGSNQESSNREGQLKKDYGLQDSKQTNYLNLQSQTFNSKDAAQIIITQTNSLEMAPLNESIDINKEVISVSQLTSTRAKPLSSCKQQNLETSGNEQQQQQFVTRNNKTGTPFNIKGEKIKIQTEIQHQEQNTDNSPINKLVNISALETLPLNPLPSFKVEVQTSPQPPDDGLNQQDPAQNTIDQTSLTAPPFYTIQNTAQGGATSTKQFGTASKKILVSSTDNLMQTKQLKNKGDWLKLQVSPIDKHTESMSKNVECSTDFFSDNDMDHNQSRLKSKKAAKQQNPKLNLGDYLAKECEELFKYEQIGHVSKSRPNVRLINQEHIDRLNYTKALQHRSNGTLEGTARSYLTNNMEQIDENAHVPAVVTIQTSPGGFRRGDGTASHVGRNFSSISAARRQQRTFQSVERLKAFRNTERNVHSHQPYTQKECKFELNATGETLRTNMQRVYGLNTVTEQHNESLVKTHQFIKRLGDNHEFEFKRVPLQRREGHFYSDVASPEESRYVKKKLLSKQRKGHALSIQAEAQKGRLAMGYNVSSPAARMRNLITGNQKRAGGGQVIKPAIFNANPVLYTDMQAIKTWNTAS